MTGVRRTQRGGVSSAKAPLRRAGDDRPAHQQQEAAHHCGELLYENLSDPEHGLAKVEVREQGLGGSRVADASAIENVSVIGERQDEVEVVLDDEDRDLVSQLVERLEDFFYHRGCESLERLLGGEQPEVYRGAAAEGYP